jgi:hypothetical protein
MAKGSNRTVYQRSDGQWVNKLNGNERATSVHSTQQAANQAAAQNLRNSGGGERTTMGSSRSNHRIVSKDTIAPGNESPARDTEH